MSLWRKRPRSGLVCLCGGKGHSRGRLSDFESGAAAFLHLAPSPFKNICTSARSSSPPPLLMPLLADGANYCSLQGVEIVREGKSYCGLQRVEVVREGEKSLLLLQFSPRTPPVTHTTSMPTARFWGHQGRGRERWGKVHVRHLGFGVSRPKEEGQ